ncbi:hypothetical protein ASC94_10145 [Massilia sp. Root418]|uniref:hypothetical protein n=1 Tax=Massilia sp. Root418 TaxID=1736532 RepID=UPI0006F8B9A9|nr:hypothetical protein [Massilia sp. Root418]KQW97142.1 hypothetical protein ASC94_10145 [Massilia sp. Root418]
MPTAPTPITALPPAPNPDDDESTFDAAAYAYSAAQPACVTQTNALGANVFANAVEAVAAATAASISAGTAASQAGTATTQAGIATTKAGEAAASASTAGTAAGAASSSAGAAAASAAAAAALAGAFVGTSSSSLAIGLGSRTFATQAGEAYTPGIFMTAVSAANGSNWMYFQVTSYSGTTLLTNVLAFGGGGTFADWNLSLAGVPGAQGPKGDTGATGGLAGGALTAHLSELKAPNITAASTTNVWAAVGNSATLIGTTPITGWGTAPQAGDKFTLIAGAVTPLTHGANSQLPGGVNYTTAVGDRLEIYAETATQMRVSIFKADGRAVTGGIATVGSTITTDTTLPAASAGYQPIQMATYGKSVKLPDATTMSVGGPIYILDNTKGLYSAGIRDSTGTLIMAVAPGSEAMVSLRDKSTAAGVWSVAGSGLEPGLLTINYQTSTFVSAGGLQPTVFVALDNDVSIHFLYWSSASFYAVVVDNTGKSISTPVTVTGSGGQPVAAFKISATQVIVFFGSGASNHSAVVLTLTGSSPNYSISVGTAANSTTLFNAVWGGEDSRGEPRIAQLTSTLYVMAARDSSGTNAVAMVISVSGSTITFGSVTGAISTNAQAAAAIYPLTATTALLLLTVGAGAPYAIYGYVLSVSGTTVTWSSPVTISTTSGTVTYSHLLLSPTRGIILANENNNLAGFARAFTISGTVITPGGGTQLFSIGSGTLDLSYTASRSGRYNPHLWAIDASTFGAWVIDPSASGGVSMVKVCTVSGNSVSPGNVLNKSISSPGSSSLPYGSGLLLPPGSTEMLAIKQTLDNTSGYRLQVVPAKIAGTTVTMGASEPVPDVFQTAPGSFLMGKVSNGDYALLPVGFAGGSNNFATGPSKVVIVRNGGDRAIVRGSISIPEILLPNTNPVAPLAAVAPNRFVLVGGALGHPAGSTIDSLQILNLELAA